MHPHDALTKHFRLTPLQLRGLKKLGISSIRDFLYHFPVRYDQGGAEAPITGLVAGAPATIFGTIGKLETRRSWKRKIPVGEAVITDASDSIKVMWFHQPYVAKKFSEGMFVKAVGTVSGKDGKVYLANPHVEPADPVEAGLFAPAATSRPEVRALFAVYPETRGVTSLWFRHAMERVFASDILDVIEDPIPADIATRYKLPTIKHSLQYIHTPDELRHAEAARKRFAFEEIFAIQIARAKERAQNDAQASLPIQDGAASAETFLASVAFPPTNAQRRAIKDILSDFEKPHPMARLLEGDVGSGKTLVAAAAAYTVVTSRPPERTSGTLQVAYMAPTEILAQQHFQSFIEYFRHLPINIALITGSGCKKFPSKVHKGGATDISRAQLLKWVANGEIAMVVGTHALIQKSVTFQHLALAIVDEQHRFGTKQRRALAQKNSTSQPPSPPRRAAQNTPEACLSEASSAGDSAESCRAIVLKARPVRRTPSPHFLSMTATPIPRTLALTIYGDLDISLLDELPAGRAKITTRIVTGRDRAGAYEAVRGELKKGRQAYVICPRIEEPDPAKVNALQARSAKAEAMRLQKDLFPEYKVGLIHGAMSAKEKDTAMRDFATGKTHILVATSVVEVGVNVPNATVIMIEGAERFGLAQLHQLRGRVMRSAHPPLCFLLPETKSDLSMKRLRTLEKSDDGFKLAEADLETRGAGDLFGRSQWGVSDIGMEALKNVRLIHAARTEAQNLIALDSTLKKLPALQKRVEQISKNLHSE